jgi:hypothetical protein
VNLATHLLWDGFRNPSRTLLRHATFVKSIRKGVLAASQFPEVGGQPVCQALDEVFVLHARPRREGWVPKSPKSMTAAGDKPAATEMLGGAVASENPVGYRILLGIPRRA